ncbi:hypothetical protein LIER_21855 [Lithospermum erythrorhizon]|uniref:Uncharacterized protein n=1 Tax=Lithospermum erythrorhizon TaxID=34254 RepID=A0AAV3QV53_LITER
MAGNGRFELSSSSPDSSIAGNYSNGQRGSCPGLSLDRSGSFREINENRMFSTGRGASRGSITSLEDLPQLSQCLMLEPIAICDHKISKTGELRRALGFGNNSEDNTFGASHLKSSPLPTMDELTRYRESVADTCGKASGRAKKLDEHLHKLNKYCEAVTSKKQQRNEPSSNERSGASGFKIGAQIHRSPSEFVSPKVEERPKNAILNKRVRTSVAETQAEFRNNGQPRKALPIKERDMLKDNNADIDVVNEKIRRLPPGGDCWDKRMKKKRSIGVVGSRSNDGDAEMKKPMLHKPSSEPLVQSCDLPGLRIGASVGTGAAVKSDGASPAGCNVRAVLKKEQDKSIHSRDVSSGLNKDRLLPKASFKLSIREEIPDAVMKGRIPHRGGLAATNTVSNVPSVSTTLDSWELPSTTNINPSTNGTNNHKCSLPTGPSSPPIAKWGGQRPQKISRTRRANLVSPLSNHDEGQTSSEGSPDFGAKLVTPGANGPLSKSATSGSQINKVKAEPLYSPATLSESEDSSARESKLKEKATGTIETEERVINLSNVGAQTILSKSKFLSKEDNPDGVRRQGRSGRVTSVSRVSISPAKEKLDNGTVNKPLRQIKPTSDKNRSKTGRSLKKLSDRKGFSRLGLASGRSPDCTWGSEDDREELTSAANMAYNSNLKACSSVFWKKVESVFVSLGSEDESFLVQQIRLAEDCSNSFSQMLSQGDDVKGDLLLEEVSVLEANACGTNEHIQNGFGQEDVDAKLELVNEFHSSILRAGTDSGQTFDKTIPLYQRVLSALITDDEEFAQTGVRSYEMQQNAVWNSPRETHYLVNSESNLGVELEPIVGVQVPKNGTTNRFIGCNGYANHSRYHDIPYSSCNGKLVEGDGEKEHSNDDAPGSLVQYNYAGPTSFQERSGSVSPFDCQYDQMPFEEKLLLELRSVGLYPETVPDLHDKEEDEINQEIIQLQRKLHQQATRKKVNLDKMHEVMQGQDTCGGNLEHVAMNKLVELAYKKLLATKGNLAVKIGIPKVSKQVALAFARRTLARYRRFEESGVSCFNEPALRDIISAVPSRVHVEDPSASVSKAVANGSFSGAGERGPLDGLGNFSQQMDHAFAKSGPICNQGKKKEVLLDNFVGDSTFRSNLGCSLSGGAKGKRSERDKDKDSSMRNAFAKAGCSLVNSKGDRKTKTKHKQRTAQLSTSGNGYVTEPMHSSLDLIDNNGNGRREVGLASSATDSLKDKKESTNLLLNDVDSIEDIGVESDLVAPQDLSSWFNFDLDGLQEDHDAVGLEIPMDDLSELMF